MLQRLFDPIVRRELGAGVTNAALGGLLALVVGIEASLWWVVPIVAVATAAVAGASDRGYNGDYLTAVVGGAIVLGLIWLWVTYRPVLSVLALVLVGTGIGFGANRLVFGVVVPVPESRRGQ
ncbi:hypothetical protein [Halapricum desulfuricans]|uniref:Putative membrane protein n=1 Tax=Halapricum desulfuricans TaxID=2841257 RepID=A0A897NGP9_9EURY|nr:hypothetical protein [Halapricum desulfuricans]QSG13620.1 putative membrane protein [Halapricum desulfuricans]